MILFPYKKVVIETDMSQKEFLNRFKNITLEENFWSTMSEISRTQDNNVFIGYVDNNEIKFRLLYKFEDLYTIAKVKKEQNKTFIELIFQVSFSNKIKAILWAGFLLFVTIFALAEGEKYFFLISFLSIIPFVWFFIQFRTGKVEMTSNKILEISQGKIITQ